MSLGSKLEEGKRQGMYVDYGASHRLTSGDDSLPAVFPYGLSIVEEEEEEE